MKLKIHFLFIGFLFSIHLFAEENEFNKMETSIKTNLNYLENLKTQLDKATK